jgi:hypothetical protein
MSNEPVAWAVTPRGDNEEIDCEFIYPDPAIAGDVALGALDGESDAVVVPLYRQPQPTLTDAEREAVEWSINDQIAGGHQDHPTVKAVIATLRGLLERLAN